jgi:hypothetical protein
VHPKLNVLKKWIILIGTILNAPQKKEINTNTLILEGFSFSLVIYNTSPHFWAKGMR